MNAKRLIAKAKRKIVKDTVTTLERYKDTIMEDGRRKGLAGVVWRIRLNWLFIQKDLEKLRTSPYYSY